MKKNKINLKIDDLTIATDEGTTILQAALKNGIYIPNLCYNADLKPFGACRLCLIENAEGRLVTACETVVEEGMYVVTDNSRIDHARKTVAQLLIANHEWNCLTCPKDNDCKLQEVAAYLGIDRDDLGDLRLKVKDIPLDTSNPFFDRDLKKCVLCGICVRVCSEIIGVSAIGFGFRGYDTKITTPMDKSILDSSCVSCGECVEACPVGALVLKESSKPYREVKSVCPYCGVGCGVYLGIRGNEVINVRGDNLNPVNQGYLCVKGRFGYNFINHPERLVKPLIKRNGEFEEVNWNEALNFAVKSLSKYKGDNFAAIASAKCTNEENYLLSKFTRTVMGGNNIDHCARLCHAPSVSGLSQSMGSGAMTNSINEIAHSKCILAIGTNTTSSHPIIGLKIIKAVKNGSKLIVANPKKIDLCKHAHLFLQHRSGTDVALLMGIMRVIIDEELFDTDFIREKCYNFEFFQKSLNEFDLDSVAKITGVDKKLIQNAARAYASHSPASILYAMGITQHSHGTDNVLAISNLTLLTGNVGKYGAGVDPLRGQNNVQGSCDMGALPDVYSGYQKVNDTKNRRKFENAWNSKLSKSPGVVLPDIFKKAKSGDVKAIYIMGENPILSEPDSSQVKKALKNVEFLLVQDIFLTETAKMADVVLPACSFAEKDGTYTNTERRVQKIRRAINKSGTKPDWWIIAQIAQRMGAEGFDFNDPEEIFQEIAALTPIYAGINYNRLEEEGVQWPCTSMGDQGTEFLYKDDFSTKDGKAHFFPLTYKPSVELPDLNYPFILTTGRSLYQYHTGTMSRMVEGLNTLYGHEFLEIHPEDASKLGVKDNDMVMVISRRGEVQAQVMIIDSIQKGLVSMTFHFSETPTNLITNPALDPVAFTPELKVCAVRIEKI